MLLAAALAALVEPTLLNAATWLTPDDMPAAVQKAGVDRTVLMQITVRPDGTVQGCTAAVSSGDRKLDALSCRLITLRGRFSPAHLPDGSAAYGVVRQRVNWAIGGPGPRAGSPADLKISAPAWPAGATVPLMLSAVMAVDEGGRALACNLKPVPGRSFALPAELEEALCGQATARFVGTPALDQSGKPVKSVQKLTVEVTAPGS